MTNQYRIAPFIEFWTKLDECGQAGRILSLFGKETDTIETRHEVYAGFIAHMQERSELCEHNEKPRQ